MMRGSFAVTTVAKNDPKLLPKMPMRAGSTSVRASSQSTTVLPTPVQFCMLTVMPSTRHSAWPGPSSASTATPRVSQRSPCSATKSSLNVSMPGNEITTGILPPL